MSRKQKAWVKLFGIIVILVLLVAGGLALLSNYLNAHDSNFILVLGGRPVLKLGEDAKTAFPPEIESAFTKSVNPGGLTQRVPKYIQNVLVDHEESGVIFASELNTTEQKRYRVSNLTSYMCAAPIMVTVDLPQKVDPKKDLPNYVFFFNGDGYRGNVAPDALNNFRQDLVRGDPAKLYLLRPVPDKDGTYPLVHIILFTSNKSCVNTSYSGIVTPDANITPNAK